MADLINAVALLIVIGGVIFYSTLDKLTAGNFLKVMAVAASIRLTVAAFRQDWVQIAIDATLTTLIAVLWIRQVRKTAKGSEA